MTRLIDLQGITRHAISNIYRMWVSSLDLRVSYFLNGREHELNQPISEVLKPKVIDYEYATSIDTRIK